MNEIHSYSKVYALGHPQLEGLTDESVVVQEKLDGSQFSFMLEIEDGKHTVLFRSKGAIIHGADAAGMFKPCVDAVMKLASSLQVRYLYRAEFHSRPRHNTLQYDRVPKHFLVVYDIEDMNEGPYHFLQPEDVAKECERIGFEYVLPDDIAVVKSMADLESHMAKPSMLGGAREGVVLKNYCVTPDHLTLTGDLRWVEIGSLKVGDTLIACTENTLGSYSSRAYCSSVVEYAAHTQAEVLAITLSDGTVLKCTPNHPWLVRRHYETEYKWIEAGKLCGKEIFQRVLPTWNTDRSYEAGYLAGIFDGEGSLIHKQESIEKLPYRVIAVSYSQIPGLVSNQTTKYLNKLGFTCSSGTLSKSTAATYHITGGKKATLRFLGQVRPSRLLAKVDPNKLGGIKSIGKEELSIVEIRPLGKQDIVELQTTSKTYFTNGFVSHNSRFTKDGKVMMGKYVSERFKEVHAGAWKAANPTGTDIIENLIRALATEARYEKAVQHLREAGRLQNDVRDIGPLIKEVQSDVVEEEKDRISAALLKWALPKIERGVGRAIPQFYKDKLAKQQFGDIVAVE